MESSTDHPSLASPTCKRAIRIYRGLPNGFSLHSIPIFPINRLVPRGSHLFALPLQAAVAPAGVTVPERSELAAREGPPQGQGWEQHGRGRTGTWKTRRLGQKERTPLGNL